jgi:hypothetical protein
VEQSAGAESTDRAGEAAPPSSPCLLASSPPTVTSAQSQIRERGEDKMRWREPCTICRLLEWTSAAAPCHHGCFRPREEAN